MPGSVAVALEGVRQGVQILRVPSAGQRIDAHIYLSRGLLWHENYLEQTACVDGQIRPL